MAKENKSRYALLGVLSMCPGSGYDIKKFMERSTGNFWSESYGQIYPLLKQLESEGLVAHSTERRAGKPDRYVYTLTAEGRAELQRWLAEPVEQGVERNELLLKLFFGRQCPVSVNSQHVSAYRASLEHLLRKYEAIEERLQRRAAYEDVFYPLLTLRYGKHRCQAMLAWCDETLAALQSQDEHLASL